MSCRARSVLVGLVATALVITTGGPAAAHHVVWLDFSRFDLRAFPTVDGNPPSLGDVVRVRNLIVASMVRDFAPYDIYFTIFAPEAGRRTTVEFRAEVGDGFGRAISGTDSWRERRSLARVFAGTLATLPEWQGDNATTARIANALAHTGSHELAHVLGLSHCHGADDYPFGVRPCPYGYEESRDRNQEWHVMSILGSVTMEQQATLDRFFNARGSRPLLYERLQPRAFWSPLADLTGGVMDLGYGRVDSTSVVPWFVRPTASPTTWRHAWSTRRPCGGRSDARSATASTRERSGGTRASSAMRSGWPTSMATAATTSCMAAPPPRSAAR